MKLINWDRVSILVGEREHLLAQRRGAESDNIGIEVVTAYAGTMRGHCGDRTMHRDGAFSTAVRPAIVAELDRRIDVNAASLTALGVEVE